MAGPFYRRIRQAGQCSQPEQVAEHEPLVKPEPDVEPKDDPAEPPPQRRGRGPNSISTIPARPEDRPMLVCVGNRVCTVESDDVNTRITRDLCGIAMTFNKDCHQYSK